MPAWPACDSVAIPVTLVVTTVANVTARIQVFTLRLSVLFTIFGFRLCGRRGELLAQCDLNRAAMLSFMVHLMARTPQA
jgi:hypothetical protein